MNTKTLVSLGSALWLAGAALSFKVGLIDAPADNEPVVLAILSLWSGLLAFMFCWSCALERLVTLFYTLLLILVTELFALELVRVAGALAWMLEVSWVLSICGGAVLASLLRARRV